MNTLLVYVTCKSFQEAENIAMKSVKSKLAACANIGSEITSIYEWGEKIEKSKEIQLFLKTTSENYQELENLIKKSHSYDVPCIMAIPVEKGNRDFLEWIERSVKITI